MNLFATAIAETTSDEVSNLVADAAAVGTVVGITLLTVLVLAIVWYILQVIADWKIFTKAGEPGWKSIIPFYNIFVEYQICWSGIFGLVFILATLLTSWISTITDAPSWLPIVSTILGIVACVLHFIQSVKLAKSFDKGTGFGILLFLFGPICRMVLGFGKASYIGPQ